MFFFYLLLHFTYNLSSDQFKSINCDDDKNYKVALQSSSSFDKTSVLILTNNVIVGRMVNC